MSEKERQAAIRAVRNAYQREWRRKNPDKVRAAQEKYWEKRAAEMAAMEKKKSETTQEGGKTS